MEKDIKNLAKKLIRNNPLEIQFKSKLEFLWLNPAVNKKEFITRKKFERLLQNLVDEIALKTEKEIIDILKKYE